MLEEIPKYVLNSHAKLHKANEPEQQHCSDIISNYTLDTFSKSSEEEESIYYNKELVIWKLAQTHIFRQ